MPISPARTRRSTPDRTTSGPDTPARGAPTGLTLAILAAAQFVVALDYNIVYVALPEIGSGLGFTAQSLQWVVSSYAVTFGGLLLLGGRLVDRIGARRMFALGVALFGLACLVGGFAGNPGVLLAARALQGVGAAMLAPATLSLINTGFAEGVERTRALAIWSAAGSAGLAAGALLGGVLTELGGWRWVMFVMVPRPRRSCSPHRAYSRPIGPPRPDAAASTSPAYCSPPPARPSWSSAWSAGPTRAGSRSAESARSPPAPYCSACSSSSSDGPATRSYRFACSAIAAWSSRWPRSWSSRADWAAPTTCSRRTYRTASGTAR